MKAHNIVRWVLVAACIAVLYLLAGCAVLPALATWPAVWLWVVVIVGAFVVWFYVYEVRA